MELLMLIISSFDLFSISNSAGLHLSHSDFKSGIKQHKSKGGTGPLVQWTWDIRRDFIIKGIYPFKRTLQNRNATVKG